MKGATNKKILPLAMWILAAVLAGAQVAWGINTLSEGYQITNTNKQIKEYSTCYYAKSTDGKEYFFPTATGVEFQAFVTNKPTGVTLETCQWLYNNKHTSTECTAAGGTVYTSGGNSYCRFNSCPSGWTSTSYRDYYTSGSLCSGGGSVVCTTNGQDTRVIMGSNCHVPPGTYTFVTGAPNLSCNYTYVGTTYGSWTVREQMCSLTYVCRNVYTCGGYPYTCGFQNVCGLENVCNWINSVKFGQVCDGPRNQTCTASGSATAVYCY